MSDQTLAPEKSSKRVPITSERLADFRYVGDIQLSPDGQCIACVLQENQPGQRKPNCRVWKVKVDGGEPEPLSTGKQRSASPRWSPDGKSLAFLAWDGGDQDKPQLYLISMEGGESRVGAVMPNGVSDISWSPDSKRIAFCSLTGEDGSSDPRVFTPDACRYTRLWTVCADDTVPSPVTPEGINVWEYVWSPDSQQMALYYSNESEYANGSEHTNWYRSQIGIVPVAGGVVRQLTQFKPVSTQTRALAWSPDGQYLAYVAGRWSDPGRGAGDLYALTIESGETRNLTPGITSSLTWCTWFPDSQRLLYTALAGVTHQIGVLDRITGSTSVLEPDFVMFRDQPSLSLSSDMAYCATLHSTAAQHPEDIYVGTLGQQSDPAKKIAWRRITKFNPLPEETWIWAKNQRIEYASVDGTPIHALFTPPIHNERGTPPPLFVDVHGGPSAACSDDCFPGYAQILPSAGYAVLQVNYRGSWGEGVLFADAVLGDMGGKDFQDILGGIDYLIAQGLVDGERLAIGGWSNGGFLAAWAVTQTTRFKLAVVGAGITDWLNMHAQTNISDADILLLQADPLERPDIYQQHSPLTFARNVVTPTLILHGENDRAVPVAQAYAFYRALCERKVPTELAVYPSAGHGLRDLNQVIDANRRILHWLEKYVK